MKEAANIDYRLDPIVTEACLHERNVFWRRWLYKKKNKKNRRLFKT